MNVHEYQSNFQRAGLPELKVIEFREYGCTICQRWHAEDDEPELFAAHLHAQSKHGWRGTGRYRYEGKEMAELTCNKCGKPSNGNYYCDACRAIMGGCKCHGKTFCPDCRYEVGEGDVMVSYPKEPTDVF